MNIMDMFNSKPADPNANSNNNNSNPSPNNKPVDQNKDLSQGNKPNKDEPNDPKKASENPFDNYQVMFENAAKNSDIQAPVFSLDPAIIKDVSSKMDFTKGVNPELVQRASSGNAGAMIELMQAVGRNAYSASLEHTTRLTDTHLGQRNEFESKRVQRGVKDQMISDNLSSGGPNLQHPIIKAELNQIARRFANSPEYADASPADIAQAARQYLTDLHTALNPVDPKKTVDGKDKPVEVDYMKYLQG